MPPENKSETAAAPVSFQHVVLTRFWFRRSANGRDSGPRPEADWFEGRCKLFAKYCLPSVAAQSAQDFTWLIYFDSCTPAMYLDRLREMVAPYPNARICTADSYESEVLARDARAVAGGGARWLLTTRLDTDDGWHRDFVKRLHAGVRGATREFLNFPTGLIFYDNRIYLYRHRSNAFISLLEPAQDAITVYCGPHESLGDIASIRQLDPSPAFLQVIHGSNLSNKPRGTRVRKIRALDGFEAIPELSEGSRDENDAGIMFENATSGLVWNVRDRILDVGKGLKRRIVSR